MCAVLCEIVNVNLSARLLELLLVLTLAEPDDLLEDLDLEDLELEDLELVVLEEERLLLNFALEEAEGL